MSTIVTLLKAQLTVFQVTHDIAIMVNFTKATFLKAYNTKGVCSVQLANKELVFIKFDIDILNNNNTPVS